MTRILHFAALGLVLMAAAPAGAQGLILPLDPLGTPVLDRALPWQDGLLIPAQSRDDDYDDQDGWKNGDSRSGVRGESLNQGVTKAIVRIILHANDTCNHERVERRYRIDCLRVYYGWAADSLPDRGEYLPVKKALRDAERELSAIVSANLDRTAPVIEPREGHKKNAKRLPPLRPVKKSAEKKALAQAQAVVKETELVILRSGEDPARRETHFNAVAEAVDSNLVILRSA